MARFDSRGQCTVELGLVTLLFFVLVIVWLEGFASDTRDYLGRTQLSRSSR